MFQIHPEVRGGAEGYTGPGSRGIAEQSHGEGAEIQPGDPHVPLTVGHVWAVRSSAGGKGKEQQETKLKLKCHANQAGVAQYVLLSFRIMLWK